MERYIGIRHRVKRTAEGESRPTMVAIKSGEVLVEHKLATETDELDFLLGRFPFEYRDIEPDEDLGKFRSHQVEWRKLREGEDASAFPRTHTRQRRDKKYEVARVPKEYDGLATGDTVAMVLGGSGDRFAYALSRRGQEIGATVMRIPPFVLKERRGDASSDQDHIMLVSLAEQEPSLFYAVGPRDRDLIRVQEVSRARRDAQKDRIACEQRLRSRLIGQIFLSEEGRYPEGSIEDEYDKMQANDVIYHNLSIEEKQREQELKRAVRALDIWRELFDPITGVGEVLAAGIIAPIGDIRRFASESKLKAFAGVHVLPDGRIPRKRLGSAANWNAQLRQALYLLGDQFNYRPDSPWGQRLREYKRRFRETHPEPIVVKGKKRYSDAHIHKMAIWRTLTKFVEWLHREWTRLEQEKRQQT